MPGRAGGVVGVLYGVVSPRARRLVALVAGTSLLGKLALLATATLAARGAPLDATVVGLLTAGLFAAHRALAASARVAVTSDVLGAAARAALEADVLALPTRTLQASIFEAGYEARTILSSAVPELLASALATAAAVPLLVAMLPERLVVVGAVGMAAVALTLVALRRRAAAWQERVVVAEAEVFERVVGAVEGRLELVAEAADERYLARLGAALSAYHATALRAGWATALYGRAPVAAGVLAVVVTALLAAPSRDAFAAELLANALLLAASVPFALSAVLGASEVARASARARPLVELFATPPRPELSVRGERAPSLPAPVAMTELGFAYSPSGKPVLRGVELDWAPGRPLVLRGANGAGKSTLLKLLLGLRAPTSGEIALGGRPLGSLDLVALRRDVAYLPQRPYLGEPHTSVRESMRILAPDASDDALVSALARVELGAALSGRGPDALEVPVGELSAGQRQRLALARVLVRDAKIVLLDEPDANLDRAGVALVARLVTELSAAGVMVAIAAHTPELTEVSTLRVTL